MGNPATLYLAILSAACKTKSQHPLSIFNPEFRPEMKCAGVLRRDSRIKEHKKPGLKRARRAPQFSKR